MYELVGEGVCMYELVCLYVLCDTDKERERERELAAWCIVHRLLNKPTAHMYIQQ